MATASDIIEWVAGKALDRKPTADEIPAEAVLAEWLPLCPTDARAQADETLAAIAFHDDPDRLKRLSTLDVSMLPSWRAEARIDTCAIRGDLSETKLLTAIDEAPKHLRLVAHVPTDDDARLTFHSGTTFPVELVHHGWRQATTNSSLVHPLLPLVRAWLERPLPTNRARGGDRILPMRMAHVGTKHRRAGRLFTPAAYGSPPNSDGRQMMLPFSETELGSMRGPALPLILYRLGEDPPYGGFAPVPLRLWVEAVRSVPYLDRGRSVRMETTLRQLMSDLWPGTHLRPREYLPKLERAAQALDSWEARIAWNDPDSGRGGLRRVVSVADFPRGETYLDDLFSLIVDLPPGAKEGPALPAALNAWGAYSALAYVGLINLHLRWHDPGVLRVPVGRGRRQHWVQVQRASRYADLSDDDLLDIFYPVVDARPVRRNALANIRRTIAALKQAGGLRGEGRKLLPPRSEASLQPPPPRQRRK